MGYVRLFGKEQSYGWILHQRRHSLASSCPGDLRIILASSEACSRRGGAVRAVETRRPGKNAQRATRGKLLGSEANPRLMDDNCKNLIFKVYFNFLKIFFGLDSTLTDWVYSFSQPILIPLY